MHDPVYHWYDRWRNRYLSCRQLFCIITLVLLLPAAFLAYHLWQEISKDSHELKTASLSLIQQRQFSILLQEIIEHEQFTQRSLLGDSSLQTAISNLNKRIDPEVTRLALWARSLSEQETQNFPMAPMIAQIQTITRSWKNLSQQGQLTPEINLEEHLKIAEAIRNCLQMMQQRLAINGQDSVVILLLNRLLYIQLPNLQQEMMHLASLGEMQAHNPTPERHRTMIEVMALIQQEREIIQSMGQQAMRLEYVLNHNQNLQALLETPLASLSESVEHWLREVRSSDEKKSSLAFGPFVILATEALGESAQTSRVLTEELHKLLNRSSQNWNKKITQQASYFSLFLLAALSTVLYLFRRITRGLDQLQKSAEEMERGNFNTAFSLDAPKELSVLGAIFNRIGSSIQALLYSLQSIKNSLVHSTGGIHALSGEYDQALLKQETSNHQMAIQTKELTSGVDQILEHTQENLQRAEKLLSTLKESRDLLQKFSRTLNMLVTNSRDLMHGLAIMNSQSQSATELVNAMTQIADRTNLLSLNTAIEAEKMGSAEGGFGIIADEVRRLADQTAHSTLNMEQAIEQIASSIGSTKEELQQLLQGLEGIGGQVQQFDTLFSSVQTQVEEEMHLLGKAKQIVGKQQIIAETLTQAIQPLHEQTEETIHTMEQLQTEFRHLSKSVETLGAALETEKS